MNKRVKGDAKKVAQVQTITIGTFDAATTYTVTSGTGKTYSVLGTTDAATTASNLKTALAAATDGDLTEITFTVATNVVTCTAKTAGIPFTLTVSVSGGAGTISTAVTTANSGPSDLSLANNYDPSGLPSGLLTAPVQSNAAAIAGGSLVNTTTYYWVITATNANGETVVSNEKSLTIANPNNTATLAWAQVTGTTGYKVYRSTTAGVYGATSLVTTITSGSTLTYNDTGTALTAGTPPGTSTATADEVFIDEMCKADLLYNLDALTDRPSIVLHVIGFTKKIGLPEHTGSYREYRKTHLEHRAVTVNIDAASMSRCKLKQMATVTTMNVRGTGSASDQGQKALMLQGSTITTLVVQKGDVGLAAQSGETLTVTTLRMGYLTNVTSDAKVKGGTGLTVGTVDKQGGQLELNAAVGTLLTNWAGDVTFNGAGAMAGLIAYAGTITYNSTGVLGGNPVLTESPRGAAVLDFSKDPTTKTVTNPIEVHSSRCRVLDPNKVVTTLVIDYNYAAVPGLEIGANIRVTRGTPA